MSPSPAGAETGHAQPVASGAQISFLTAVRAIVWKDLRLERRTRQTLSVMLLYALAVVIMFNFALETDLAAARTVATGLLWATIVLAGTLGLNRSLGVERENGSFDALLMAPIDRTAIYVGKVAATTLFALLLDAIMVVAFIVFFDKPYWRPGVLLVLVLGTVGYVAIGVLVTSLTIGSQSRDVLLPVLLLPLSLPLLLPAATAVSIFLLPSALPGEAQTPLALVVIYDILMLAVGLLTYRFVVEA